MGFGRISSQCSSTSLIIHPRNGQKTNSQQRKESQVRFAIFRFQMLIQLLRQKLFGELAQAIAAEVLAWGGTAAMVEGEFTLTYALVQLLMRAGVVCYAATSKRETTATLQIDGSVARNSVYRFVTLRRYVDDL